MNSLNSRLPRVFSWIRDWSKSIGGGGGGGGWAGAFGNVVDKKHMTHPLPSAQK